jgi:hypothetical protein
MGERLRSCSFCLLPRCLTRVRMEERVHAALVVVAMTLRMLAYPQQLARDNSD